ncbi:cyclic nucleotide-binding domain-containing protein [Dawidia soli]|uniref:Cyclic nucleotide-binding domain-containing protein n=1 Tax=Dawidia soli TaxID=2782352 RepID=A0AAP2D9T6_9BACT|nr:cyclic nucleotide-binding domain-containing protein [Dawidia soli]MBT1686995.1 cyclic nucleotide-binding domain-containing protein [Dawidia soli]
MAKGLANALRIKSEEQKQIVLMLCTGFFMGVFIATYQVTADSLFLNRMGSYLDKAFLVAGGLGIITTSSFAFFQNRIRFTTLALGAVTLILAFTLGAYWLLNFGDQAWHNYFIFALYCMSGPMTAILLLSFWGIFGRLFNFRQSKRIIGWIDTGQLIAAILATLVAIPFTSEIIQDTSNYLLVCAISIAMVCVLLLAIASSFTLSKNDPREFGVAVRRETRLVKLFGDKYIRTLCVFLLISMVMFVLSQYSFQELVTKQYTDERSLTNFNSFFVGAVYGISLIMQTFVNQRIISNYGLRVSLIILPAVTALFAAGCIGFGLSFGFEKELAPTGFIYFFLFVALTRLFNWTLRDSLENPVFKLFFIPLDNRLRFSVQSKVEGLMNEVARFVAGLAIFGLAFVPFFNMLYISAFLILLAGAYFVVVGGMYQGYRNNIRIKLEGSDIRQEKLEKGFTQITQKLERMLDIPQGSKAVFSYKLLEKINAGHVRVWVNSLMRNEAEPVRHYAQEKMNELKGLSVSDQYVIRLDENRVDSAQKNILSRSELQLIIQHGGDITQARIRKLARSNNVNDRHYAAELLQHTSRDECTSFLLELLIDSEPTVRNTAIKTSIQKYTPEIINAVIENLGSAIYSNQAMNALVQIGAPTLQALDTAFYRSGQSTQMMLRIVQVIGRVGGQRAKEILWNKIDYPNKVVVSQVLLSLGECGFKAGISQITRIKYAIESDMADISWNLSAIQEVGHESFSEQIKTALQHEINGDIEHIYMLLTMLYDTRSIQLVKENIDSGTAEGVTYAIELLDVFLSEQLKQRVIPILDDISEAERISRLENFYPRIKLDSRLVLKFIINRDFTQSNRWTKACVLFQIGTQRIEEFKLDLIAQLFNPDLLIREVSAWALHQISTAEYEMNTKRLGADIKRELDTLIIQSRRMTRFEKILLFQKSDIFEGVPGVTLSYLADLSEELRLKNGESLTLDERANNHFYVLVKGEVALQQRGEHVSTFAPGQFIGEMLGFPNDVNTNILLATSTSVILKLNKDQFYELLSDNVELADKVVEYI